MQTLKDSLHLTKEKLLETHYQNFIPLPVSGEVETGSAGEQPASNNLADWNGLGNENSPISKTIPRIYDLENLTEN